MRKNKFIETFAGYMQQGTAAVFIGAGLSMEAGYPSWPCLVREMAEELELDLDREPDLAGVVQFFLNRQGKTRTRLTNIIQREIGKELPVPKAYRSLARLPIRHAWTTNYDTLPERAWHEQRKQVDVKSRNEDLVRENPYAHAVLYKMHGSVAHVADVVIAKGDYEAYRRKRAGFLQLLTGHLISKHMLFLGLSFTDANLAHLFTIMRETFEDDPPEHFAIVRRPKKRDEIPDSDRLYEYAQRRHALWVEDLKNYGIQCVEIDEYEEINEVLVAIERRLAMSSVMISGSFPDLDQSIDRAERVRLEKVAHGVGRLIAEGESRLVSGFGRGIGSAALSGALEVLYAEHTPNLEQSLYLRPFPQLVPPEVDPKDYWRRYREDLVSQAGICIFIAGVKEAAPPGADISAAEGVIAEFEIVRALGRIPIPIGATGGAAGEIWRRISSDYETHLGKLPRALFDALGNGDHPSDPEALIRAVGRILAWLKKNDPLG